MYCIICLLLSAVSLAAVTASALFVGERAVARSAIFSVSPILCIEGIVSIANFAPFAVAAGAPAIVLGIVPSALTIVTSILGIGSIVGKSASLLQGFLLVSAALAVFTFAAGSFLVSPAGATAAGNAIDLLPELGGTVSNVEVAEMAQRIWGTAQNCPGRATCRAALAVEVHSSLFYAGLTSFAFFFLHLVDCYAVYHVFGAGNVITELLAQVELRDLEERGSIGKAKGGTDKDGDPSHSLNKTVAKRTEKEARTMARRVLDGHGQSRTKREVGI